MLSFLPPEALAATSLLNYRFQVESEFHLYRFVKITTYAQFCMYRDAVINNDRRRFRLVSFHVEGKLLESAVFLIFGADNSLTFENLIEFTYLPGNPSSIPFRCVLAYHKMYPATKLPRLQRLHCDCDIDDAFTKLLKCLPTITSLSIVSDYVSRTHESSDDVLPYLEELACRLIDFPFMAKSRPLRKVIYLRYSSSLLDEQCSL